MASHGFTFGASTSWIGNDCLLYGIYNKMSNHWLSQESQAIYNIQTFNKHHPALFGESNYECFHLMMRNAWV
jgi:hypothetical protein